MSVLPLANDHGHAVARKTHHPQSEICVSRAPAVLPTRLRWCAEPLIHIDRRHACFNPGPLARVEVKRPDDDASFEPDGETLMGERQGRYFDSGLYRPVPGSIEPALASRRAKQTPNLFVRRSRPDRPKCFFREAARICCVFSKEKPDDGIVRRMIG